MRSLFLSIIKRDYMAEYTDKEFALMKNIVLSNLVKKYYKSIGFIVYIDYNTYKQSITTMNNKV